MPTFFVQRGASEKDFRWRRSQAVLVAQFGPDFVLDIEDMDKECVW